MKADPYKLLLYEEGSFFKPHKDTEKVPGMVATMVICLPSKHEGGSVHLSHGGRNYIFETDKTSDFCLTTLSWFSDVTHEVKPLKSGHRLVLTYNIIHVDGLRMSAHLVDGQSAELRSILVKWRSTPGPGFRKLIYKLEHKYTEPSLSLGNLKGRDHRVCQCLLDVSSDCGFTILLAKLNRSHMEEESFYPEYDEEETNLEYIKTCDGNTLCKDVDVEETEILGQIWNRKEDSSVEGEYTGNEGMPATLHYHDTVIIILPTRQLRFLPITGPVALMSLVQTTQDHQPNEHQQISSLIDTLEGLIKRSNFDGAILSDALAMAIKYKHRPLYREAVYSSLKSSDARQKVLERILQLMKKDLPNEQPDWDFWFGDVINGASNRSLTTFQDVMNHIESMLQKDMSELMPSFRDWKTPIPDRMTESKKELDVNDYDFLVCQLFSRANDSEWLTWFISTLSNRGSRQLICAILRAIYDKRDATMLTNAKDIFQSVLTQSTEKLALKIHDFPVSIYMSRLYGPRGSPSESASPIRNVIDVLDQSFRIGLTEQATALLDMSCTNIYQYLFSEPRTIPLPDPIVVRDFLLYLVEMLQKHAVTLPQSFKDMFIGLLRNVLVSNPPKYPKPHRGWAHNPRPKCYQATNLQPCKDCDELNAFLVNPDMEVCEFRMGQKRRDHLQYQLSSAVFRCQSETKPPSLTIRKLGTEYREGMKDYKQNLAKFEDHVRALRCEYVESLLGEELYGELILLKDIPESEGSKLAKHAEKRKPEDELEGSIPSRPKLIE